MQGVSCNTGRGEHINQTLTNSFSELRDTFYSNSNNQLAIHVCLNYNGLLLQQTTSAGITKDVLVKISEIIGGRCVRLQKSLSIKSTGSCGVCTPGIYSTCGRNEDTFLYVFAYILKKNKRNVLRRERTVITLRFRSFDSSEDNMREAEKWYKTLITYRQKYLECTTIKRISTSSRRLLILLNPKSGSGKAKVLFQQYVMPVLNEAELPYDLFITKHSKYAFDLVQRRDMSPWSGIVSIGGDGLFHEVLNGILQRSDWQEVLKNISFGIIPCGTGNGLARSIAHSYNEPYDPKPVLGAALTLVNGQSTPMDIVEVQTNNKIVYSFLSLGWGLISDIDIESELLRPFGYKRFTLWTIHRIISLRTYRGTISYLPKYTEANLNNEVTNIKNDRQSLSCNALSGVYTIENITACDLVTESDFEDVVSLETQANQSLRSQCGSWLSSGSRKSTYFSIAESVYLSISDNSEGIDMSSHKLHDHCVHRKRFSSLCSVSDAWIVESGDYIMIHAVYQSHLSSDCHFSPNSKLNDGTIYLIIIRGGISRSQLLTFLINMSSGSHLPTEDNEFIQVIKVEAFRLEPEGNKDIITIDGERVECGTVQAKIIPAAVNIMIPKTDGSVS